MTDMTVAKTILEQMGGQRRLQVMVGARDFAATDNSIQFSFKGCRLANKCQVELDYATDTYIFRLFKWSPRKLELVKVYELDQVYCDMLIGLFEQQTGLYLRF